MKEFVEKKEFQKLWTRWKYFDHIRNYLNMFNIFLPQSKIFGCSRWKGHLCGIHSSLLYAISLLTYALSIYSVQLAGWKATVSIHSLFILSKQINEIASYKRVVIRGRFPTPTFLGTQAKWAPLALWFFRGASN